jgi:predicted aspartyl protease
VLRSPLFCQGFAVSVFCESSAKGKRTYELADGSEIKLDITTGEIEFMGEIVGSTIFFGPDDAEPILGVTALESVGIEVDPRTQRLKRLPGARLK